MYALLLFSRFRPQYVANRKVDVTTPTAGFEESQESQGKTQAAAVGGNAGGNTNEESELLAAWRIASNDQRASVRKALGLL
ncbi:MAG TPA: hypothetical protein DDW52_16510 [Planctomycetaceae bacterium]|nr:hypothetical protein [Planctomycetaceae bacterium]